MLLRPAVCYCRRRWPRANLRLQRTLNGCFSCFIYPPVIQSGDVAVVDQLELEVVISMITGGYPLVNIVNLKPSFWIILG